MQRAGRSEARAPAAEQGPPGGGQHGFIVSPLFSIIYMRRFIVGWKVLGHARRFEAEIVNYADDFVVCGKAPADMMRGAVEDMMERLRLPINVTKTRSMRVPDEPLEFLGYRIGRNYRQDTGRAYIGTCPSRSSLVSVCRRISELTHRRYGLLDQETVVRSLNRAMTGWANYFQLGQALGVPDCLAFRIPPAMVDRLSLARFRRLFDCGEMVSHTSTNSGNASRASLERT